MLQIIFYADELHYKTFICRCYGETILQPLLQLVKASYSSEGSFSLGQEYFADASDRSPTKRTLDLIRSHDLS